MYLVPVHEGILVATMQDLPARPPRGAAASKVCVCLRVYLKWSLLFVIVVCVLCWFTVDKMTVC